MGLLSCRSSGLSLAQMSDAFSIVDANGTPIQYGSSQKPRRRSSPPNDALSDPTYYLPVPTAADALAVTPAAPSRGDQNLTHAAAEVRSLSQRRLDLPPPVQRVGSARLPRTPRTLNGSADDHGRSDASRCLNPSNVCVHHDSIHVNAASEWSLDWSNANASFVGRGPGGAPLPKRANGAAGARAPLVSGPVSGGAPIGPLAGLAAGVLLGWLLGWLTSPSDAVLALLRLPGGLWASAMQTSSLLLAPLSVATALCDIGWAPPRSSAASRAVAWALASLLLTAAAAACLGFGAASLASVSHLPEDAGDLAGPAETTAAAGAAERVCAEAVRVAALLLPGWGGAAQQAALTQATLGALGFAAVLGARASHLRTDVRGGGQGDGEVVARVASAALRLLHALGTTLLRLAPAALFSLGLAAAAASAATAAASSASSAVALPSPPKLLGTMVAAQAAHIVCSVLLVALFRRTAAAEDMPWVLGLGWGPGAETRSAAAEEGAAGRPRLLPSPAMAPARPGGMPVRQALQVAAAAAGTGSALGALPLALRGGVGEASSGACERTARLVLPLGACLCVDGLVVARCAALGTLALLEGAPLSLGQMAGGGLLIVLISIASPPTEGPHPALATAAAALGLSPSPATLALLAALELATRPAAAAASALGACAAASVASRAGPWERSPAEGDAAGEHDPLSS